MSVLISQSVINYVEEENIPALKALLEKCKDVDERNECGQTPLMIAAEQGNLEIVKELIKNGANCNLEDLVYIKIIYLIFVFFFSLTLLFVFKK